MIRRQRRPLRLREYDYASAGAYFVTVCTRNRECLFGDVVGEEVVLNAYDHIVVSCWNELPVHYLHCVVDTFVVMPNHVHGIVFLNADKSSVGAGFKPAQTPPHGLPEIVRGFKTFSARRINARRKTPGLSVWQRNYYEHVIRNEESLNRIRQYIADNPTRWGLDRENPEGTPPQATEPWEV